MKEEFDDKSQTKVIGIQFWDRLELLLHRHITVSRSITD